ncbi:MAG: hypothetical protein IT463_11115 [Planctomycetes bacterium]|nr:hypothetical protein [Planctomycetota bacterium]
MIDKQTILDSMLKEFACIEHLAAKVQPGTENWRPSPGQRSTLELLRYLTVCGVGPIKAGAKGDWEIGKKMHDASEKLALQEIPAALKRAAADLKAVMAEIPSGDFQGKTVKRPNGDVMSLGRLLLDTAFKYLPAYKMQLFLYLKQNGHANLNTFNVWRGQEPPAK